MFERYCVLNEKSDKARRGRGMATYSALERIWQGRKNDDPQ